jgi:hypothetical protein
MAAAVAAAPEKLAQRKTLIEHCWGTLKWLLPGGFLVRGKVKVGAEVSLAHFGYNLKRALAVAGLEQLLAALGAFLPGGRALLAPPPVGGRAGLRIWIAGRIFPKTTCRRWLPAAGEEAPFA